MSNRNIITTSSRPDLQQQSAGALLADWPAYVLRDRQADTVMPLAWKYFPELDIRLLEDDAVAAGGWAVPIRWDGNPASLPNGYDGALPAAITAYEHSQPTDTLCMMAIAVRPDRQRSGLAAQVIAALRERAEQAGLRRVVAPVRPPLKSRYPLIPMMDFARWTRPGDGFHPDAWVRAHQRLGARVLGPAPDSMIVTGTVAEWEGWAAMAFPDTGQYVVPRALDLVDINREADRGTYRETNLWMRHS